MRSPDHLDGDEGPDETAIVRLADKRLYAIFRKGGNALMGQTWSSDDGRTWTQPVSIGFKGLPRICANWATGSWSARPGGPDR